MYLLGDISVSGSASQTAGQTSELWIESQSIQSSDRDTYDAQTVRHQPVHILIVDRGVGVLKIRAKRNQQRVGREASRLLFDEGGEVRSPACDVGVRDPRFRVALKIEAWRISVYARAKHIRVRPTGANNKTTTTTTTTTTTPQ
jgi:hypothetical protein